VGILVHDQRGPIAKQLEMLAVGAVELVADDLLVGFTRVMLWAQKKIIGYFISSISSASWARSTLAAERCSSSTQRGIP